MQYMVVIFLKYRKIVFGFRGARNIYVSAVAEGYDSWKFFKKPELCLLCLEIYYFCRQL